ncbi:MAG: VWA domain-containing protein [Thiohalomonadales bacterium]
MAEFVSLNLGQFSYFHFLRPWWLLVLIPLLITLRLLWLKRDPLAKWQNSIAPHLLKVMLVRQGRVSWFNPVSVSMLMVILGVLSLAGPSWQQQPSPFSEDIAALVIILDVSSSMQQQDIQPSRLERAKQKIHDLILLRPGGRVGLVVYAGTAHSVIPLTNDVDVVNNFLNAIVVDMMPRKGKFPEKALAIADQMLQDSPVPGTILVISDGISPQTKPEFEQYFASNPHQLLVFGIGTETAVNTEDGKSTLIPLESGELRQLASLAGGFYQALSLDKDDVIRINRRINNHLVIVDDGSRPWVDAGYYVLFPMLFILLLWFRKGWTLHWCLLLLTFSAISIPAPVYANESVFGQWRFMDLWLTDDQQGRYYLEKGDYKTAAGRFQDINWKGIAYYRDENFKAAIEMFSRIETVDGFFNLANAYAQGRYYVLAVKTYDIVLKMLPEHPGALKNKAKIQAIIDEINQMSEAQRAEMGESSKELGEDEPQTAEGAERKSFGPKETPKQLTADDVILDEKMNDIWMRQVQRDPSRFLSIKFYMQLEKGQ